MFPYVGLATLPIFCEYNWPKSLTKNSKRMYHALRSKLTGSSVGRDKDTAASDAATDLPPKRITYKHKFVFFTLLLHCFMQIFLPYSHFVTKVSFFFFLINRQLNQKINQNLIEGYNNWTNGLYGYSWDMMVHSWNTVLVAVKIVDNKSGNENYLDTNAWVDNKRWSKHADMTLQYAQCIKKNLLKEYEGKYRRIFLRSIDRRRVFLYDV